MNLTSLGADSLSNSNTEITSITGSKNVASKNMQWVYGYMINPRLDTGFATRK